jgi:hypothetical protein
MACVALGLAACGGNSGGGGSQTTTPAATKSLAVKILSAVPANICLNGGITVLSGIDTNGNGVLDDNEGSNAQIVCNGLNGSNALISVTAEAAGNNCSAGGSAVGAGLDLNGDRVLDSSEVTSKSYLCNSANITTGVNGSSTLLLIVPEGVGSHCPTGGSKFTAGLDTNHNQILDDSEVTSTSYACNGGPALTAVSGHVAANGYLLGARVTLDLNDDRVCDSSEPSTTTDGQGGYYFDPSWGQHMLCVSGGVDVATLKPFTSLLTAPTGSSVISPLSSLINVKVNAQLPIPVSGFVSSPPAATITAAATAIANQVGLSGTKLLTTDPIAAATTFPALTKTSAAVETLIEQVAIAASGASHPDASLYAKSQFRVVSALTNQPINQTNAQTLTASLGALAYESIGQTVDLIQSTGGYFNGLLQSDHVASLTAPLVSKITLAVASVDASQFASGGGATNVKATVQQYATSLLDVRSAYFDNLVLPPSTFICNNCLTTGQLRAAGESAVGLLADAIPVANTLYLDVTSLKVNDVLIGTPTVDPSYNTISIVGPLNTVSMQMSGAPSTSSASAGITINKGDLQLELVIDKLDVSTVNGHPFLSVPSDAKLYASYIGTTATFSNISSLLSTDANGVVTVNLAEILALNIGGEHGLKTDYAAKSYYSMSLGLHGLPVGIKNASGTTLAVVTHSMQTPYGSHLGLGTNFTVDVIPQPQAAQTPVPVSNANLLLDMTTLKINNTLVTSPPNSAIGLVTLSSPMTQVSMQLGGSPEAATGQMMVDVYRRVSPSDQLQWLIDQVDVATVNGKPSLTVPNTAKLYAYYRSYKSGQSYTHMFSNVGGLLSTDANGIATLDMNRLLTLLNSMGPNGSLDLSTSGTFDVSLMFKNIPMAQKTASGTTAFGYSYGAWFFGYGNFSGTGPRFSLQIQ